MRNLFLLILFFSLPTFSAPLASWFEGKNKERLVHFVEAITNKNNPNYIPPEKRLAVFDLDGTLWVEKPHFIQGLFTIDRIKKLVTHHPEWKTEYPFSAVFTDQTFAKLTLTEIELMLVRSQKKLTVESLQKAIKKWLAERVHPRFNKPYTQLIYQPMLEVLAYLRAHNFKIYIVTGSSQDFVRMFATDIFHIAPSEVIGSSVNMRYAYWQKNPELIKEPMMLIENDKAMKPAAIHLFIGQKPILAFGNSDGDKEMLEWVESNRQPHLVFLIHHDDPAREYRYGNKDKVFQIAKKRHWQLISMKKDWKIVFPFEKNKMIHSFY